jgi:hypothetical protein
MENEEKPLRKVKSVIIDDELKEWEEWGNKWFGGHEEDVWSEQDNRRGSNKKRA